MQGIQDSEEAEEIVDYLLKSGRISTIHGIPWTSSFVADVHVRHYWTPVLLTPQFRGSRRAWSACKLLNFHFILLDNDEMCNWRGMESDHV